MMLTKFALFFQMVLRKVDYPTKLAKMQNVSDITLFVPSNFGADSTVITYLGFKGESTKVRPKIKGGGILRRQMKEGAQPA